MEPGQLDQGDRFDEAPPIVVNGARPSGDRRGEKVFLVETTVGRAILFDDVLPDGMPFYNYAP